MDPDTGEPSPKKRRSRIPSVDVNDSDLAGMMRRYNFSPASWFPRTWLRSPDASLSIDAHDLTEMMVKGMSNMDASPVQTKKSQLVQSPTCLQQWQAKFRANMTACLAQPGWNARLAQH